jgi:hypothetical protein
VVILSFLFRMRIAVLVLLAVMTAGAAALAFWGHKVPVGALFLTGTSLLIAAIAAFVHLRHAGLAVLAAVAPLPGMLAVGPFAIAAGFSYSGFLAVYGFAAIAGACLCGDIVHRILNAAEPGDGAREALSGLLAPAGIAVAAGAVLVLGWLFRESPMLGLGGAGELAMAVFSTSAIVAFGACILPFGEGFFVIANRARERRENLLRLATRVLEPRWAMSLSGIVLVFATLGGFGVLPVLARSTLLDQPALWGGSALLLFLAAFGTGRDWREALAATLALAVLALLSLVLWGKAMRHLTETSFIEIAVAAATALFLMLAQIFRSRAYRRSGDAAPVARLRALEDLGLAPWFGAIGAAAATIPWIVLHGSIATLSVMFLSAAAIALLAMPALASALESLVPRRRSVEELYGRG